MKFAVGSEAEIELNPTFISQIITNREEMGSAPRRLFTPRDIANSDKNDHQETTKSLKNRADGASDSKTPTPSHCWCCKSARLRVVKVENSDRRILECANRRCLATIEYTDLPVGTIIEHEKASKKNYGWYLRDTAEMVYPTQKTLEMFPNPKFEYVPEVLYDFAKQVVVRCPGQRKLVLLE
ncbi:hypothetical protein KIN20_000507 [Parelaphostrongylus tenuis]|uniref:Uncharacterized protein n=1 Tax=Parelaphostrongylus tenuis TaxID=148309 RepID=A0AAD5LVK8_PARTN|nr:hypothetical protein KIN20_000507 [Parelaphostrongylus tenuis]